MNSIYEEMDENDRIYINIYKSEYKFKSQFSLLLNKIIEEKNLNIDIVSNDLNIDKNTISDLMENDVFDLNLYILIFNYLGYSIDVILKKNNGDL